MEVREPRGAKVKKQAAEAESSKAELFLEGLLGAVALGVLSGGQLDVAFGMMLAAVVLLGWVAGTVSRVASVGLGIVGIAASLPGIAEYLAGDNCLLGVGLGWRIAMMFSMAAMFAYGGIHTIFLGRSLKAAGQVGLGWFSMVELLTFASTTAVLSQHSVGFTVVLIGVLALGAIVGRWPQIGIWAVGVGMALITIAGSTYAGVTSDDALGCQPLSNATGSAVTYLASFIPVWIGMSIFRAVFRR